MGQSTDAILCFGVCVASETVEPWEELPEHEDDDAEALDIAKNPLGFMAFMGNTENVDGVEIELVQHQSSECPEYIVAAKASVLTAHRGYPQPVLSLETKEAWEPAIRAFCKKHKVRTDPQRAHPRWIIASDWS